MVEKLVPGPFIKTKIEHNSESTVWNVTKFGSNMFSSRDPPKYVADHLPLNKVKLFLKKRYLKLVSLHYFLQHFKSKIFLTQYFINWPNFILWLPLLLDMLCNICIVNVCCQDCDIIIFKINRTFLIKPFFYMTKKLGQKYKYLKNEKRF